MKTRHRVSGRVISWLFQACMLNSATPKTSSGLVGLVPDLLVLFRTCCSSSGPTGPTVRPVSPCIVYHHTNEDGRHNFRNPEDGRINWLNEIPRTGLADGKWLPPITKRESHHVKEFDSLKDEQQGEDHCHNYGKNVVVFHFSRFLWFKFCLHNQYIINLLQKVKRFFCFFVCEQYIS